LRFQVLGLGDPFLDLDIQWLPRRHHCV
jgi:hypothetical protein